MNLSLSRSFSALWLALALAIVPVFRTAALAQDSSAKPAEPPASAVPAAPTPTTENKSLAANQAAATSTPAAPEVNDAAVAKTSEEKAAAESGEKVEPSSPRKDLKEKKHQDRAARHNRHHGNNPRVRFFSDSTLDVEDEADALVSIIGSSSSAGNISDSVVSILGSSTSSGEVGDSVVSVFGSTRITGGSVGDTAVAVFGNNYIDGHVHGDVVAVFGNAEFGPNAVVDGEVTCVGGNVIRDPKAVLNGGIQNVGVGDHGVNFQWLTTWVTKCLLYGRPLAFDSHLIWAWGVALAYLVVYLLISILAPDTVAKCIATLEERPGKSIVAGLLTMLLTPLAYVLLTLTVFIAVGVALIPLFTLGLFIAGLFGRVVMLAWLGSRILRVANTNQKGPAVISVALGGAVILLLYTIPVIGFVTYKVIGILGLGVVVYTGLLSSKNNRAVAASAAAAAATSAAKATPVSTVATPSSDFSSPPPISPGAALPPVISAATLPRAGFWLRLGASLLDVIMVAVMFGMLSGVFGWFLHMNGSFPFWFALYNIAMWATKGTTIGGVICGLKVVRLDDRPIDWGVAIVRGLGAFLSLVVGGLGFIWVAFDDEKQSWHDKIAGTTIVQVPRGTSLL